MYEGPKVRRRVLIEVARARTTGMYDPGRTVVVVAGDRGRALAAQCGFQIVDDVVAGIRGLVDARALDAPAPALDAVKESLFLAQRAHKFIPDDGFYVVVTASAARSAGAAHAPLFSALHGLAKTAALEWPNIRCAAIDLEPEADVREVLDEIRAGLPDREVILGKTRRVPELVDAPLAVLRTIAGKRHLVVSGGARGVTASSLLALAEHTELALLLLGRTPLDDDKFPTLSDEAALKRALIDDAKRRGTPIPIAAIGEAAKRILAVREIKAFLQKLEARGARVMYRAVDVRDASAVARACADARATFGPITGIVHGAGVLADKRIDDKTRDQVDRVMDTKVLGLLALLEATKDDPIDTIALFSSVAGRFGNVGQVDYSMANEALNEIAVSLKRERPAVVVKSFNWGPWEGGMVTPALKKVFEKRGVQVLSHEEGARHFVDEIAAGDPHVEVIFGGELAGTAASTTHHLVDARTWPMLADHAIRGVPVLPVVAAIEIVARAFFAATGRAPFTFTDVRVLRGIQLPRFLDEGHILEVRLQGERATIFSDGARAYEMSVSQASLGIRTSQAALFRGGAADVSFLFHGPMFRLIEDARISDPLHLCARVRGVRGAGWPGYFVTDAAAFDAALQLALVWARSSTGGAYLPTSIERVDIFGFANGSILCSLAARKPAAERGVVDVELAGVASLRGVEIHRLPNDDAFSANGASP